jgi:hypothetical protein
MNTNFYRSLLISLKPLYRTLKPLYRALKHHHISIKAFCWLNKVQRPKELLALKSSCKGSVHLVCPGPSSKQLLNFSVTENDSIIFVNHAVGLATELQVPSLASRYFITADTTRLMEIIKSRSEALALCKSIFTPANLCHLNEKELCSCIDIILKPKLKINLLLGLEMQNLGVDNINILEPHPTQKGFGSIFFGFQLAALLGTKKIVLWGVDHGKVDGQRYFDNKTFTRLDTPFKQISNDVLIAKQRFLKQGIQIVNGPDLVRSQK